jgi:hypothetical protein
MAWPSAPLGDRLVIGHRLDLGRQRRRRSRVGAQLAPLGEHLLDVQRVGLGQASPEGRLDLAQTALQIGHGRALR